MPIPKPAPHAGRVPARSCWRSSAPASCSPASTCSSSTSRCRASRATSHDRGPRRPVLGPQRLRDRLRLAAGPLRPPGRPPPPRARLPARRGRLHARLGRLRGGDERDDAGRLPPRAGGRRRAADADVAEPGARDRSRPSAATARCGPGPRSAALAAALGPGGRRPAGGGELALGVPGQRPDRPGGAGRRLATAARTCRAIAVPRPDALGAAAGDRRGRRADARPRQGQRLGLGLDAATIGALAGVGGRCWRLFVVALPAPAQPAGRAGAVPGPRASPARRSWRSSSRSAFGAMLLSIVLWDQDVWGWSALQTGLAVAPGPLMVPLFSFLVAGRLIARFGAGPVIGARRDDLRRRRGLVGAGGRAAPRLRRRRARRHAADRRRRRPDAADVHGHRDRLAAAAVVRDRLGAWSTCCARSASPSAWRCWSR